MRELKLTDAEDRNSFSVFTTEGSGATIEMYSTKIFGEGVALHFDPSELVQIRDWINEYLDQ